MVQAPKLRTRVMHLFEGSLNLAENKARQETIIAGIEVFSAKLSEGTDLDLFSTQRRLMNPSRTKRRRRQSLSRKIRGPLKTS